MSRSVAYFKGLRSLPRRRGGGARERETEILSGRFLEVIIDKLWVSVRRTVFLNEVLVGPRPSAGVANRLIFGTVGPSADAFVVLSKLAGGSLCRPGVSFAPYAGAVCEI